MALLTGYKGKEEYGNHISSITRINIVDTMSKREKQRLPGGQLHRTEQA